MFDKDEKDEKQCSWCEKTIKEDNFGAFRGGILVMMKFTVPYYFDSKDCLLNWIKGLVKGEEVR